MMMCCEYVTKLAILINMSNHFFLDHHSLGFIYFFYVFFLKRKLPQLMKNFLHFSLDQHHRLSPHRRVIKT